MGKTFSLNWYVYKMCSLDYLNNHVQDYYQCRHCGHKLLKGEAKIPGHDTAHSARYVRCPRCGRIITCAPLIH